MTTLTVKSGDTIDLAPDEPFDLLSVPRGVTGATIRGGVFKRVVSGTGASFKLSGFKLRLGPVAKSSDPAIRLVKPLGVVIEGGDCEGWIADAGVPESADKLDATERVIGRPAGRLLVAEQGGDGLVVENLTARRFHRGFVFSRQHRVINRGVAFSELRTTGWAGVLGDDCTFEGISYSDAAPWRYGPGDHGDFFHPWTAAGWATNRLTLRDATFNQGIGAPLMGVYLDDNKNVMGFADVLLERVTVFSGHGSGFRLENCSGVMRDCAGLWSRRGARGADKRDTPAIVLRGWSAEHMRIEGHTGPGVPKG